MHTVKGGELRSTIVDLLLPVRGLHDHFGFKYLGDLGDPATFFAICFAHLRSGGAGRFAFQVELYMAM